MTEAIKDLGIILDALDVVARDDLYAFAAVDPGAPAFADAHATVLEEEAMTVVLPEARARDHGLPVELLFAWLTLTVHSSLEAVGLTAAFSRALADAGISCNVLAGYHHDHLLVPAADRDRAIATLQALRTA